MIELYTSNRSGITQRPFWMYCVMVLLISPMFAFGQMQVTSGVFSPKDLIENVFLSSGVQVLDVQYEGDVSAIGYFSAANANIGIPSGIVMSTGLAFNAATMNNSGSTSGATSGALPDPDLASLVAPLGIQDLSAFEIKFIPYADTLEFRYVFASEEYQEYVCTAFNDVFGFFISGTNFNGPFSNGAENIALVPGTSSYVAINTVNNGNPNINPALCPPQNPQLFNLSPPNGQPTYDGFTDVFLAQAIVVPCDTYTIRIAIADVSDQVFDSGVFLEAKSFGTPTIGFELSTKAFNETIAEGCVNGSGKFSIRSESPVDLNIPITFVGTATNGLDYTMNPPTVSIPAGSKETSVTFDVLSDGVLEGTESIGLAFQRNPCLVDTLWFYITDDTLPKPDLGLDLMVCPDADLVLDGTLPVILPDPKTFANTTSYPIPSPPNSSSPLTPVYSPLQVTGVYPKNLGPGMIESVCFNINHLWIDDIDVYLFAPSGRFIELTSDNGRDGDHYVETCFSPKATQRIDFGDPFGAPKVAAPFTGTFVPEGQWHQLWDAPENPANGQWRLLVIDDAPLPDGELLNWRITFNPDYQLNYAWSPGADVTCDTCSFVNTLADSAKTLILSVTDSYGCAKADTIAIGIQPFIEKPTVNCAAIGFKDLLIEWDDQQLGEAYEISVNGGPWQIPNAGNLGFFLGGLNLLDSVTFVVRALGQCNVTSDTIGCRTIDCTPPQIQIAQVQFPSCFGAANGSFDIQVNATGVPFVLSVNGTATNPGAKTGLTAGTYQVLVSDTLNCTDEIMVVLSQPDALTINGHIADTVDCANAQDGSLSVMITGGTYPYQFSWQNGSTDSVNVGLAGGAYPVTITDMNGCSTSALLDLYEYPPLASSLSPKDPTCQNIGNGEIIVQPSGGAGGYSFDWNVPGLSGAAPGNLTSGSYQVTVTDANGCTEVLAVNLSAPQNMIVNFTANPTSCFGGDDGAITITVSGGLPPYDYIWSDGGPNTNSRLDLIPGIYSVTVSDQGGCVEVIMPQVFQPSEIITNLTITPVSCAGGNDGTVSILASGGGGGHSFAWSVGGNGPVSTGFFAGIYYVSTTDASGCIVIDTFTVPQPNPIVLSTSGKNVSCFGGSNGSATVSASGGNGSFSFLWNDPGNSTQASISNLAAGTYTVTVTDNMGCSEIDSVVIIQPAPFNSVLFAGQISCFGVADGSGTVTPLGGVGPYTYLWSDPAAQTGFMATNLAGGTYFVTITDNNNCTAVDTLLLIEPAEIVLSLTTNNVTCFGANDGSALATATGGTSPYQFNWSTGSKQAQVQNLTPGSHTVTVTDNRGCKVFGSVNVQQAPEIVISGTAINVFCAGDSDGSIDLTVSGGAPPYSYLWNNGALIEDPVALGPGIYVVSVTDAFNCVRSFNIPVTSPPGMLGELEKIDVACFGDSTGTITTSISGGSPSYSYVWSNGDVSPNVSGLRPGFYSVTVTDQNGCTIEQDIEILEPNEPLTAVMIGDTLDCFGDKDGRITFQASGGTPAYRYSLDSLTFNGSNIQIGLPSGTYYGFVRDKLGCEYAVGQATVYSPPEILVDLGEELFIELGRDTQLVAQIVNGIPPFTYQWYIQDSAFLSCMTCPDPIISGLEYTRTFRLNVTDANGCTNEALITVNVNKTRIVLVPTAFTPNGDNRNDRLGVLGRPGTIIQNFRVYDRWGELVHSVDEFPIEDGNLPVNSWDGMFRGKPMNGAVYVWMLEAIFVDGERTFLKGQTTLLR